MVSFQIDTSGTPLKIKIICGAGETDVSINVQDIYEFVKDAFTTTDIIKYPIAMTSEGNQSLGGYERLGNAFFLYTDSWKIAPVTTEASVRIQLNGNLFANPAGGALYNYDGVTSKCFIEMRTSTLPSIIETGVSGLTVSESEILTEIRKLCGLLPAAL